jgi:hypothetical protein
MRKTSFLIGLMACLLLTSYARAQELQSGSVRGKVVDENGQPLPGVSITISGPALLGKVTAVTNAEGQFRAPFLTPGSNYEIKAELTGFETVTRKGLIINVGKTISVELQMKPSTLQEEVTITAPTPTVDVVKSTTSSTISSDVIQSLPLSRDMYTLLSIVPGAVGGGVHGDAMGEVGAVMDGIQMSEPDVGGIAFGYDVGVAWDMVEEAQIVTAGATAEFFNSQSGLANIVMKSGGNKFSGEASVYYTNQHLASIHIPDADLQLLDLAKPSIPIYSVDTSLALGGPIVKDRLWFMGEFRYIGSEMSGDFRPTVINGVQFNNYNRPFPNFIGYLKFSTQLSKDVRASIMGHYSSENVPYYYGGWNVTDEANFHNWPRRFNYAGTVSWTINSNTILDLRAGGQSYKWTGQTTQDGDPNGPAYIDAFTGYQWGQNSAFEQYTRKPKFDISLTGTKFVDNFLGGNHELKVGLEWERNRGDWGFYGTNPLTWYYYNGSPYYWAAQNGGVTDPVYGDGWLNLAAIGTTYGASDAITITSRVGGFIQDSYTIKRLTINLGLRADHLEAWVPASTKGATTDQLALDLGAAYFEPIYGFNPYAAISYPAWNNAFPYGTILSPRVGLTYDLFGNGKTALKASFSRSQEGFPTSIVTSPLSWYAFDFSWFDSNHNGVPDPPGPGGDTYQVLYGETPLNMISTGYLDSIDPHVKMPYILEYTAGIEHELVKNVNVGVRYVHKDREDVLADVLWDQSTGQYWYTHDQAPQWWIPFTTTVPAYGNFPAEQVTMYFQSNNAPPQYYRLTNIPQGVMKYHAVEITFDKRLANGWQLGGSVSFTQSTGNYPVSYASWASFYNFANADAFVNSYGQLPYSRPVVVKLYGTIQLPYQFMFSFNYYHIDGLPWGRTVTVEPPAGWAAANNVSSIPYNIYVEPPGTERSEATDNLDLRLEKDFHVGRGKLAAFVDIFNLLGAYTLTVADNPGGIWAPTDINTAEGTYTPGSTGLRGFVGNRLVKFSLLYRF